MPRPIKGIVALLLVACLAGCDQAVPTGSTSAAGPSGIGPTSGPQATDGVAPPAPTAGTTQPPSSLDLITAALADGSLDFETALTYRLYAQAGDDRLPAAFAGPGGEDPGASVVATASLADLSAGAREQVLSFLVRPTNPMSWWAPASTGAVLTSARLTASACVDGWIRTVAAAPAKATIWGRCGGQADASVQTQVDAAAADITALWEPMTALMGPPIPDRNLASDTFADSPEAGDGLIDIYLVDRSTTLHGRTIQTGAEASTWEAAPVAGAPSVETASGYIVVNTLTNTGITLKSTIAHEFFHVLEHAHSDRGLLYQPPGVTRDWIAHWFSEAAAVWAEHHFVPEARSSEVYPRFKTDFQPTKLSLSDTANDNEYASWVWPLFMEQEIGPFAISDAWKAMEGKDGFNEIQAALDAQLSFSDRFRDFAVRVFNTDLQPGNAIDPRFQGFDPEFPDDQPSDQRATFNHHIVADVPGTAYPVTIPSLWSQYWDLNADTGVKTVKFDFSALVAPEDVDVELLLLRKGQWSRERGDLEGEQTFCDVQKVIVVVANHDQDPRSVVSGSWDVLAISGGGLDCEVGSWHVTLSGPKTGAGTYAGTGQVICSAPIVGGRRLWSAGAVLLDAPFGSLTDFTLLEDESGRDTVGATAGGMETGSWHFFTDMGNGTASVVGTGEPGTNGLVTGDGSFTDSAGKTYTAHITAECSETYY